MCRALLRASYIPMHPQQFLLMCGVENRYAASYLLTYTVQRRMGSQSSHTLSID